MNICLFISVYMNIHVFHMSADRGVRCMAAEFCSVLHCVVVCCSVMQCVAVICSAIVGCVVQDEVA